MQGTRALGISSVGQGCSPGKETVTDSKAVTID